MRRSLMSRRGARRASSCVALVIGMTVGDRVFGQFAGQIFEDFNTNPSARGWTGSGNRTSPQNYGWSGDDPLAAGTFTGGSTPGEMGGAIQRTTTPSFYGVPLPSGFDLGNVPYLIVTATVNVSGNGGSGFYVGYGTGTNSFGTPGSNAPTDFLGDYVDNSLNNGDVLGTATGSKSVNAAPPDFVTGKTETITMIYDANGFPQTAAQAHGRLDIAVNGLGVNLDQGLDLGANNKFNVDTFNWFQIMPLNSTGSGTLTSVWFDNLSYTAPPNDGTSPIGTVWSKASGGVEFTDGGNWTSGAPNGVDAAANLLGVASTATTVLVDSPVTLGTLRFANSKTYNLAGFGSMTMQVSSGSALIEVLAGVQKINVPLTLASNTTLHSFAGDLEIADPLTVNSGVSVTQSGLGTVHYQSTVSLQSNANITFGNTIYSPSLSLADGATATVAHLTSSTPSILHLDNLSLNGTSKLDLADNGMALNYSGTSPIGTLTTAMQSELASGWTNPGITSSTVKSHFNTAHPQAIALLEASALGVSSYLGEPVDSTTVILRPFWQGDANVDGTVNALDFNALATHFGSTSSTWLQGDFNYDGVVNTLDFNALALNFGLTPNSTGTPALGTPVPEPAALALLGGCLAGLAGRRRRDR